MMNRPGHGVVKIAITVPAGHGSDDLADDEPFGRYGQKVKILSILAEKCQKDPVFKGV